MTTPSAYLQIEARGIAERLGVAFAPGSSIMRVAERLDRISADARQQMRVERDEARGEYEAVRDCVIERLNPRDDDIGEVAIITEAIEVAARFIESAPCTCPPDAGEPDWESLPCQRCQALGRARDERIDR